jgi:hypothetical protein
VSSVTEVEPEFDDDDRAWVYALTDVEAEMCPGGCGQPLAESTAVGADDDYDVQILACHACTARARRLEDRRASGEVVRVIRTAERRH